MFRRCFESANRRPGVDPATFATELGILAMRGFGGDMGKHARDSMIRDTIYFGPTVRPPMMRVASTS